MFTSVDNFYANRFVRKTHYMVSSKNVFVLFHRVKIKIHILHLSVGKLSCV